MRDRIVKKASRSKLLILADEDFWMEQGQALYQAMLPGVGEAATAGVEMAALQLYQQTGITVDWAMVHADSLRWARQHTAELVGTAMEREHPSILRVSRENVKEAVTNWIEAGEPLGGLVDTLEPTFGKVRADMIATTEVTRARYEGNLMAWKEAGIPEHEWDTARDQYVCPICEPMQGVRAPIGSPFPHPDGINYYTPPAHPRCRCDALPVTANG